jgi:preprotein translocase subunit SecG
MKTSLKLKLLEFWLDDYKNIPKIPNTLKEVISNKDASNFYEEIKEFKNNDEWLRMRLIGYYDKLKDKVKKDLEISILIKQTKSQEKILSSQEKSTYLQKILAWATITLAIATIVMAIGVFYQGEQTQKLADLAINQLDPMINIEFDSPQKISSMTKEEYKSIENFALPLNKALGYNKTNGEGNFALPLNITIYNLGTKPETLKNIYYYRSCSNLTEAHLLKIDANINRLIKPEESLKINTNLIIRYFQPIEDNPICEIKFEFDFYRFIQEENIETMVI